MLLPVATVSVAGVLASGLYQLSRGNQVKLQSALAQLAQLPRTQHLPLTSKAWQAKQQQMMRARVVTQGLTLCGVVRRP
jgi:hypothetical protein